MPLCDERMKGGRCMFQAVDGATKCQVHDRCVICAQKHDDRRLRRCTRCGQTLCAGVTSRADIFRDGEAHKRDGQWCGPVDIKETATT